MARTVNIETQIQTNPCTLSYVHLVEPYAFDETQEAKYSTTLLIDKNDQETVDYVNNAVDLAAKQGAEKFWKGRIPSNLRRPLLDGDDKADKHPEFAGKYYINAKADVAHPPLVTDIHGTPITKDNRNEIYSGCKGFAVLSFYPYSWNGASNGIGVSLRAVVKTEDGDPLGGGSFTSADLMDLLPNQDSADDESWK